MVVGPDGRFLTQRTHPRLALIETAIEGDRLVLLTSARPSAPPVHLALAPSGPRRRVRIWDDECDAVTLAAPGLDALLEACAGEDAALVYMPDDVIRAVEAPFGAPGDRVGFADAYPVLLATRASLADLNARLAVPVPMSRFRPNLVIEGGAPYEEDRFGRVRIGDLGFRMPKRCARCSVTTVDQLTAEVGKEPLRTLAKYRTESNTVYFAQNMIPDRAGTIAVGDVVTYADA